MNPTARQLKFESLVPFLRVFLRAFFRAFLMASVLGIFISGCGVKGKPQPPLTPPELGRGQPTFKRATEEFRFPEVPNPNAPPTPTPKPAGDGNR